MHIPAELRRQVSAHAGERCEYCGLAQAGQEATFHTFHIHPASLGGVTEFGNLALACVSCSLRKAAKVAAADPLSGELMPLFHPRRDLWNLHFRWSGFEIVGISQSDRATVDILAMNRPIAVAIRQEEALRGRHPPPGHL